MRLQYTGMHDAVRLAEVFDPRTGQPIEVERGVAVDIPDDVAERLIEQRANWRVAAGGKLRDYADIAAEVSELEAAEAEAVALADAGDGESPTDTPSDTGGNTDEG